MVMGIKYPKVGEGIFKLTEGYQCFMKEAVMKSPSNSLYNRQTIRYVDFDSLDRWYVIKEIFADFIPTKGVVGDLEHKDAIF